MLYYLQGCVMSGIETITLLQGLSAAAGVVGTVMSAKGAAQSADAEYASAMYNSELSKQEAAAEESRRRRESSRQLASIRAGRAKSGVTGEGSPLLVLAESAEQAELDALNARWQGTQSSQLYEMRAKSAAKSKKYAVGSELLSGVSQVGRTLM